MACSAVADTSQTSFPGPRVRAPTVQPSKRQPAGSVNRLDYTTFRVRPRKETTYPRKQGAHRP